MTTKVLIVEDEQSIRDMIKFAFYHEDFIIDEAEDTRQAKKCLKNNLPDLVLLDWMLPGKSGIDFVKDLRAKNKYRDLPIIMLTAKGEEKDKLKGFNVGIDDYVTKPFSPKELLARIAAVLRRSKSAGRDSKTGSSDSSITIEQLKLSPETHRVQCIDIMDKKGQPKELDLGPLEYKLLSFFMTHTEKVYSRSQLLDHVWGDDCYIEDRTVDVHIRRLRKVLASCNQDHLVQTVRGSGYRFSTQ